jgi:hypothetical protein
VRRPQPGNARQAWLAGAGLSLYTEKPMKNILCLLVVSLVLIFSGGITRADDILPGHEKVSSALKELEKNVGLVQERLGNSLAALSSLQGVGDLKNPYGDYRRNLEKLQGLTAVVDKNTAQLDTVLTANYSSWQAQIDQIQDKSLKSLSTRRLTNEQQQFQILNKNIQAAQKQLAPVSQQLKDIDNFLRADLTPSAVKSLDKTLSKAAKDGAGALKAYDQLKQDFQKARQSISASAS